MKRVRESVDVAGADAPTRVVKLRRRRGGEVVQGCDVYIGRRMTMGGWNLPHSDWANPFTIKQCGGSAAEAVRRYDEWIRRGDGQRLLARIDAGELSGKVLGCWCKKRASDPCHGDVLVRLVDERSNAPSV